MVDEFIFLSTFNCKSGQSIYETGHNSLVYENEKHEFVKRPLFILRVTIANRFGIINTTVKI